MFTEISERGHTGKAGIYGEEANPASERLVYLRCTVAVVAAAWMLRRQKTA